MGRYQFVRTTVRSNLFGLAGGSAGVLLGLVVSSRSGSNELLAYLAGLLIVLSAFFLSLPVLTLPARIRLRALKGFSGTNMVVTVCRTKPTADAWNELRRQRVALPELPFTFGMVIGERLTLWGGMFQPRLLASFEYSSLQVIQETVVERWPGIGLHFDDEFADVQLPLAVLGAAPFGAFTLRSRARADLITALESRRSDVIHI